MNLKFRNQSLKRDYLLTVIVVVFLVVTISTTSLFFVYKNQKNTEIISLISRSHRIESVMDDSLDYVSNLIKLTGIQVARNISEGKSDKIIDILSSRQLNNNISDSLFSWTKFDWISANKKVIASGEIGILPGERDVSHRYYAKKSEKEPWKLHFSDPSIGIPSGNYIIPVGMGIADNKNKFLGIIGVGIDISKFSRKIELDIANDATKFIVVDNRTNKPAFFSSGFDYKSFKLPMNICDKPGIFQNPIKFNNVDYLYCEKLSNYPFSIIVGYSHKLLFKEVYLKTLPIVIAVILIGSVSLILLFVMRQIMFKPIIQLSEVANKISKGEYIKIPTIKSNEMKELATQLGEIQKIKFELENALNIKTAILNNLSHEIRSPVHGASGIAQVLIDVWHTLSDAEKFENVKKISRNNARLAKFINNILDMSKFTAGKMQFDFHNINLLSTISDMLEEVKELYINSKNVEVILSPHNFFSIYLKADELRISQLLRNIITNAIRYTKSGKIILSLNEIIYNDQNSIEIAISDEGIGIPENEIESIFEPFVQSSYTNTSAGGTGLGLSICKEIIAAHNGAIWAKNNSPKKGATFHIVLPVISINTNFIELTHNQNIIDNYIAKNLLFVDDEQASHDLFTLIAMKYDLKISHAFSGFEAILKIKEENPDIVLLDLMMPDITGSEVVEIIKNTQGYENLPIIIQTGMNESSQEVIMLKETYKDIKFIIKPYNQDDLFTAVFSFFQK